MIHLEQLIRFGGIVHFGILSASALVPVVLNWRESFKTLSPLARQLVCAWAGFIVLVIIGFGLISLINAHALADGTRLSRTVCGVIGAFWLCRLGLQLFVFDVRPVVRSRWLWAGYHGLTVAFIYFATVYGVGAFA